MSFSAGNVEVFLSEVVAYFDRADRLQGESVRILATGIARDGAAVVVYEQHDGGPSYGLHVDLDTFATLFSPRNDVHFLARTVATDEIAEPNSEGRVLDVDWANGLVSSPASIVWKVI